MTPRCSTEWSLELVTCDKLADEELCYKQVSQSLDNSSTQIVPCPSTVQAALSIGLRPSVCLSVCLSHAIARQLKITCADPKYFFPLSASSQFYYN